jgi:hypothetical protein
LVPAPGFEDEHLFGKRAAVPTVIYSEASESTEAIIREQLLGAVSNT